MSETKPLLLFRKYRSLFNAALTIELVLFSVTLTDTVVAANVVGQDALSAVGLLAPFIAIAQFIAAAVNSGTIQNYSYHIGRFEKDRADEFFSTGLLLALGSGALLTAAIFLVKPAFIASLPLTPAAEQYLREYYDIILLHFFLAPVNALLDNVIIANGGERYSVVVNTTQIVVNVVLSVVLALAFGVRGIAVSHVTCKAAFTMATAVWLMRKKDAVRFIRRFSFRDSARIVKDGAVRASTIALKALMVLFMNWFILRRYDAAALNTWIIVQKVLELSAVFLGLVLSLQPLTATLIGEKNIKAVRMLAGKACRDLVAAGAALALLLLCFTPAALRVFGVKDGKTFELGLGAVRMISPSLIFTALAVFFFAFYYMTGKPLSALLITILNDLVCPVGLVLLLQFFRGGSQRALWAGFAVSPLAALLIAAAAVIRRYGKDCFPFLLAKDRDSRIFIRAFPIEEREVVRFSEDAAALLERRGYGAKTRELVSLCIEEFMLLIRQKNDFPTDPRHTPPLSECTLMTEEDGVRLIIRDMGKTFDLTDEDVLVDSFRQYMVARIVRYVDFRSYVMTTGYNRHEFFFREGSAG